MSLTFFTTKEEETTIAESINNYKNLFESYTKQCPSLKEALDKCSYLLDHQKMKQKN